MPMSEPRAVALKRDGGFVQPRNLRGELNRAGREPGGSRRMLLRYETLAQTA